MSAVLQPPSVGRVVHYVDDEGCCRAAMIVKVLHADGHDSVRLQVFRDDADGSVLKRGVIHAEPSSPEDPRAPDTWHWPERV